MDRPGTVRAADSSEAEGRARVSGWSTQARMQPTATPCTRTGVAQLLVHAVATHRDPVHQNGGALRRYPRLGVPTTAPLAADRPTAAGEREAFERDGHVCIRALLTPDEVERHRPADPGGRSRGQPRDPVRSRTATSTAGRSSSASTSGASTSGSASWCARRGSQRVAAELLGAASVRLYHDQALLKEPGGGHTPWHQDQFYWPFPPGPPNTVTAWIPLHDLDPAVGSMTFASGTHRSGDLSGQPISDASEAARSGDLVEAEGLPTTTHGALRAGDATFHAGWTLHRAGPNPTASVREVMTVIYVAGGTRIAEPENVYQQFDLAVWLPDQQPGDEVGGPLNPELWPA